MRLAIAAIILTDAGILAWAWLYTRGTDFWMIVFALGCVTFFGSAPVLLAARTRRRVQRAGRVPADERVIPRPSAESPEKT